MMYKLAPLCSAILFAASANAQFVNQTQVPGELISKSHPELGRLTTLEVLGDYIIAIPEKPSAPPGSDYIVRALDISDPSNPVTVATFGETNHPVLAHGTFKRGNEVYIAGWPNDTIRLEADGSLSHTTWSGPEIYWNHGAMFYPWGARHWWSYGATDGLSWITLNGAGPDDAIAEWDHLLQTGVIGFPSFMGNLMIYASDQSKTGVATYDVSDPTNPVLLDTFNLPESHPEYMNWNNTAALEYGIGGYWSAIHSHYMVWARRGENPGVQVVDFSDPNNLTLHCEILFEDPTLPLNVPGTLNPMYVNFQDEYIFAERLKINIETCELELVLDEMGELVETSQYSRPIGNMLLTGGGANGLIRAEDENEPEGGLGIWGHQSAPDNRPPYVAYHIPQDGQTNYPTNLPYSLMIPETLHATTIIPGDTLRLEKVGADGGEVDIDYILNHTGMLTVRALTELDENSTYRLTVVGIEDAVGNQMEEYSFRFSTGSDVEPASPPVIDSVSVAPDNTILTGETATISAVASDADDDTLEYRFRQSSDNSYTAWSTSASAAFTYSEPGTYSINVQVRDPGGLTAAATTNIAVVQDVVTGEPSLNSSRLALSLDGGLVWAVNPDNDTIARVSVTNGNLLGEHLVGDEPFSVSVDDTGRAWVALRKEDAIAIVDESGATTQTIDLGYGAAPTAVVMDRAGTTAYVALYNEGAIVKFDTATLEELGRVEGLSKPYAMALTGSGDRLLATRLISRLSSGEVYSVNTANMTLADTITLETSMEEDDIDNGRGVPNYLTAIIIDDADANAYVVGKKDNYGAGLANNNADIDDDNTVRTFAGRIDLASGTELRDERIDFDNADSPSALALSSNGQYLFTALQGNNQVALISRDPESGQLGSVVNSLSVGTAPRGLLFDAASEQLFVKNFTARSLSTVDASGILLGNVANPSISTTVTVTNEALTEQELWGKSLFYNASYGLNENGEFTGKTSAEGYMSCATCHLDGGQDGTTYDFTGRGEGIRNNISLYGRGGTRFGNVHWSGNFDEIHDFEGDMRNAFKGRGLMDDSDFEASADPLGPTKAGFSVDLDAMSEYVSSLGKASLPRSPHRDDIGELTESGLAGQQVFEDLGCSSCHKGSIFTDRASHDIGTIREHSGGRLGAELESISTPSLLGVFDSAPYLHDGSAQSLEEVFSVMGGVVYQAEDAERSAGAVLRSPQFAYMRGGQGVRITTSDDITFEVPSTAHDGSVRIRYGSVGNSMDLVLNVNGVSYRRSITRLARVDGVDVSFLEATYSVALADGTNTLVISVESGNGNGSAVIDEITVSTAEHAQSAFHHTRFQTASATDKDNLISYLMQIDQKSAPEDDENVSSGDGGTDPGDDGTDPGDDGTDPGTGGDDNTDPGTGGGGNTDPGTGGDDNTDPGTGGDDNTDPGTGGDGNTDPGTGGDDNTDPDTGGDDGDTDNETIDPDETPVQDTDDEETVGEGGSSQDPVTDSSSDSLAGGSDGSGSGQTGLLWFMILLVGLVLHRRKLNN